MENHDRELILQKADANPKVRRLYDKHVEQKKQIAALSRKGFLTMQEENELKKLKANKLKDMEKIMSMIAD